MSGNFPAEFARSSLLPEGLKDRVVVIEDQSQPVRIRLRASDPVGGLDDSKKLREILLTDDTALRLRHAALRGKFFPHAVPAVIDVDRHPAGPRNLLDRNGILRSADADTLERMALFERHDSAERDEAAGVLRGGRR